MRSFSARKGEQASFSAANLFILPSRWPKKCATRCAEAPPLTSKNASVLSTSSNADRRFCARRRCGRQPADCRPTTTKRHPLASSPFNATRRAQTRKSGAQNASSLSSARRPPLPRAGGQQTRRRLQFGVELQRVYRAMSTKIVLNTRPRRPVSSSRRRSQQQIATRAAKTAENTFEASRFCAKRQKVGDKVFGTKMKRKQRACAQPKTAIRKARRSRHDHVKPRRRARRRP